MKRLFGGAFIAGLLAVALAVGLWSRPVQPRLPSQIAVMPDGGRQEEFLIRWPDDRIARPGEDPGGLPPGAAAGAAVLEDSAGRRAAAELFRLRDSQGNVIGVASRLSGTGGAVADRGRSASNWLLLIPSRGALFLAQNDVVDTTPQGRFISGGPLTLPPVQTATFWNDRSRVRITAQAPGPEGSRSSGRVLRGTEEFAGLQGSYTETWLLDAALDDGSARGRIVLATLTVAAN